MNSVFPTVIICSSREPHTIRRAVLAFLQNQSVQVKEVFVVAPDAETQNAVRDIPHVRLLQDAGRGKPAAINMALSHVHDGIVIFSDGDVEVAPGALDALLAPFQDASVGAVSGHPVPVDDRQTKLGYWAHVLTESAHRWRTQRQARGEWIDASGYLMAARRELLDPLPEDTFADDPVMTHMAASKGARVIYAPDAIVHVKYPQTTRDWFRQKVRSFGGYVQPYVRNERRRMRSLRQEIRNISWVLTFPKNIREVVWTAELVFARAAAWAGAHYRVRVGKHSLAQVWQRVDSTK